MSSTRLRRALVQAVLVFAIGGGAAAYLYVRQVAPREELHRAREDEKRPFRFGRAHVRSGILRTRGATIAFERGVDDRFVLTRPVEWPADSEAIDALLDRMAALELDPILTEAATPAELAAWHLDPAPIRLDVTLRDGEQHSMLVGAKNTLVDAYPVTDADRARVGLSDPSFHWAFDRPVDAFRSRRLLPLEPKQVAAVEVRVEGALRYRLERPEPGGSWRVVAPDGEARPANPRRADLVVIAFLVRAEATAFVTDDFEPSDPEARSRFGLEAPVAEVTFTRFGGERATLSFGRDRGGDGRVHPSGTRTVLQVDTDLDRELGLSAEALADRTLSRFDPAEVQTLELVLGAEPPSRLRRTERGWAVAEGATAAPVQSWRVDALVRTFGLLEADAVHREIASPREREAWLLAPPSRQLRFLDESGEVLATVRIGDRADPEHLYAETEGRPEVFLVAERKLRLLPARLDDLTKERRSP